MKSLKKFFLKKIDEVQGKSQEEVEVLQLVYTKVPMTLELRKRQFIEEQTKRYGIPKDKKSTIL